MNKYALAVMLMTSCTAGGAMAQGGAKTPSFRGCDQWGLKDKELSDCRAQWAAAKSDAERDRVKAMYVSPAFINSTTPNATTGRGSSTPPDNLSGPAAPPSIRYCRSAKSPAKRRGRHRCRTRRASHSPKPSRVPAQVGVYVGRVAQMS